MARSILGKLFVALRLARRGILLTVLRERMVARAIRTTPVQIFSRRRIEQFMRRRQGQRWIIVIDHDLGGGAPQYREKMVRTHVACGGAALLVTYSPSKMAYIYEAQSRTGGLRAALPTLSVLERLAARFRVDDVFFNNAAAFPHPESLVEVLINISSLADRSLTVASHDFYCLCPSLFLLDSAGRYCDLPDVGVCNKCLARLNGELPVVGAGFDILEWRETWGRLLRRADKVLFFSTSTLDLFERVFPGLAAGRGQLVPHAMDDFPTQAIPLRKGEGLHIGVVGKIGLHKGARVVEGLARAIKSQGDSAKVTVFGEISEKIELNGVAITGRYKRGELPELIRKSGANVFLVPSIFPETFSYVTHELMRLQLPLICFNLGAQAEAVRSYEFGEVIHQVEGIDLLAAIREAQRKLEKRVFPLSP